MKMFSGRMTSAALFLSAAASIVGGPAYAANLVVNGSFEAPSIAPPYLLNATPTGWTGMGDLVVQGYGNAVDSGAGKQWIDLNPGFGSSNGLSQMLSLDLGTTYELSFLYNGGAGGPTTRIDFMLGSFVASNVSTAGMNVYGGTAWKRYSTTFTATSGGSALLKFTPNSTWFGGFLDDVQVSAVAGAVPETTTWAMMIAGFAATGFALRKGRNQVRFAA